MNCGCRIHYEGIYTIKYCPLHAAAKRVLHALKKADELLDGQRLVYEPDRVVAQMIKEVIAEAEKDVTSGS